MIHFLLQSHITQVQNWRATLVIKEQHTGPNPKTKSKSPETFLPNHARLLNSHCGGVNWTTCSASCATAAPAQPSEGLRQLLDDNISGNKRRSKGNTAVCCCRCTNLPG